MVATAPAGLEASSLVKRFGGTAAVDGIDVSVRPGEFFTVLGPNSPTGSIWLQHTAERTAEYIISWLHRFARGEITTVEVSREATDEFNIQAREAMKPTVWATGCNSWYLTEDGSVNLWPFGRKTMERMLASPEESHYIVQ